MANVRFPPIPDIAAATGNVSERLLKDSIRLDWPVRHAAGLVGPIFEKCRWQREPGPAAAGGRFVSYARRKPIGASRTFAIAIVALIHASLGYALVSGLAYTVIQKAPDGLKTFNVEEVQPLPPEQRDTPKKVPESQPRVVAPPSLVRTDADPSEVRLEALPSVVTPTAAPAPPAQAYPAQSLPSSPAIKQVPPRSATGDLQGLFRAADYPIAALERLEHGSVTVQLTVGVMGRVRACDVTSSSGSRALDNASCQILQSRASFTPARDSSGNLTTDTVRQEIRWMLR